MSGWGRDEAVEQTEARPKAKAKVQPKAKSRAELPECNFVMTRGPRRGQPCGKRGCKAHQEQTTGDSMVPIPVAQATATDIGPLASAMH